MLGEARRTGSIPSKGNSKYNIYIAGGNVAYSEICKMAKYTWSTEGECMSSMGFKLGLQT